jgi:hypothetical protein
MTWFLIAFVIVYIEWTDGRWTRLDVGGIAYDHVITITMNSFKFMDTKFHGLKKTSIIDEN